MAALMKRMAHVPLAYDPQWFALSVEACLGQARSSVGLVHGFAHVLEARLGPDWSHARLCSVFLLPVIRFNLAHSPKLTDYAAKFGGDAGGHDWRSRSAVRSGGVCGGDAGGARVLESDRA